MVLRKKKKKKKRSLSLVINYQLPPLFLDLFTKTPLNPNPTLNLIPQFLSLHN